MNLITLDFETYYAQDYSLTKLTTEEYIRSKKYQPKGVVWLTDGYLDGSDGKVDVPALWGVVDNDQFVAPQGKTVRIYSN